MSSLGLVTCKDTKTPALLHNFQYTANMAEIELSVLGRTMKNYIPEIQRFHQEAQALADERNSSNARVNWQFRSDDARIKLKQLYPSISS